MGTDRATRTTRERGSGLLGSVFGLAVVAGLIGLVANVSVGLWTRSTVDSVAYDAALRVAAADVPPGHRAALERTVIEDAKALLGSYGDQVSLGFVDDGDPSTVTLHVRAPGSSTLPRMFGGGPVVGSLERLITVTRERHR